MHTRGDENSRREDSGDYVYFPPENIDPQDIKDNGKLLSEKDIERVMDFIKKEEVIGKKFSKKILFPDDYDNRFSVISVKDEKNKERFFAVYKGKQQNKSLGEGSFGVVKYAQDLQTGEWVALKVENKEKKENKIVIPEDDFVAPIVEPGYSTSVIKDIQEDENIQNDESNAQPEWKRKGFIGAEEILPTFDEYSILTALDKSHGKLESKSASKGMTQSLTLMNLEHGKSLETFLEKHENPLAINQALTIIENLLHETDYLLKNGVLHRDIKPQNIIIDPARLSVSYIDFGESVQMKSNKKPHEVLTKDFFIDDGPVGTLAYTDPDTVGSLIKVDPDNAVIMAGIDPKLCAFLIKRDPHFALAFATGIASCESPHEAGRLVIEVNKADSSITATLAKAILETKMSDIEKPLTKNEMMDYVKKEDKENLGKALIELDTEYTEVKYRRQPAGEIVKYNEKTEIYSLAKVMEEVIEKVSDNNDKDREFKKEVMALVESCKKFDRDDRPSMQTVIQKYQELKSKYNMEKQSNSESKRENNKVYGINFSDLIGKNSVELENIFSALKAENYTEVQFKMDNTENFKEIIKLKSDFEKHGFLVNHKIVLTADQPALKLNEQYEINQKNEELQKKTQKEPEEKLPKEEIKGSQKKSQEKLEEELPKNIQEEKRKKLIKEVEKTLPKESTKINPVSAQLTSTGANSTTQISAFFTRNPIKPSVKSKPDTENVRKAIVEILNKKMNEYEKNKSSLSMTNHLIDFKNIISEITTKQATIEGMAGIIEKYYEKEKNSYQRLHFFAKEGDFEKEINNRSDTYHYPRLLALSLQEIYKKNNISKNTNILTIKNYDELKQEKAKKHDSQTELDDTFGAKIFTPNITPKR